MYWVQLVFHSSYLILNWWAYTFLIHIQVKYKYKIPFMIWRLQTTFSNVFSSMKMCEFRLQFHRTHICISKRDHRWSINGLAPVRHQTVIWTNAGLMLSRHLWTNFSEMWYKIHNLSYKELVLNIHDDVIKWKHFPRYWTFVRGIPRSPVNSPHKGQWHGALLLSLICVWRNGWVKNRGAGDFRRYRAHYDVIIMFHPQNVGHQFRYNVF